MKPTGPQEEHTARHSPRGACGSPAGSGGAGGLFLCRGALEDEARIVPCCKVCTHYDKRGRKPTWALTLNDYGRWACERQCSVHRSTVRLDAPVGIRNREVGMRTGMGGNT